MLKIDSTKLLYALFYVIAHYIALYCPAAHAHKADKSAAVILSYSRIDEDYLSDENLSGAQFILQMETLLKQDFRLLPLSDIIETISLDGELPTKSVAIIFDGGYKSSLKTAIPYLLEHTIPFTVFFSPQKANEDTTEFLNWFEIERLAKYPFVTLGLQTFSLSKISELTLAEIRTELNLSKIAYREHFLQEPNFFLYPNGEYTVAFQNLIKEHGYKAAFGAQAGVAYSGENLFALPRFSMTDKLGDISSFLTIAKALPLPVINKEPQVSSLDSDTPVIGFTINPELHITPSMLTCIVNGTEKAYIEKMGLSRVEIRLKSSLTASPVRVNCTTPVPKVTEDDEPQDQWRWIGFFLRKSSASQP